MSIPWIDGATGEPEARPSRPCFEIYSLSNRRTIPVGATRSKTSSFIGIDFESEVAYAGEIRVSHHCQDRYRVVDRLRDPLFPASAGAKCCTEVRGRSSLGQASGQLGCRAVGWGVYRCSGPCVRLAPAGRANGGNVKGKGFVRWGQGSHQGSSSYRVRSPRECGQFLGRCKGSWRLPTRLPGG